jgi:hypothetical protein
VPKDLSIRVAVGTANGRHSTVWSIFTTNDEVYAAHRNNGHVEKFSFHSSRICRRAYIDKRPLPVSMSNRVFSSWIRAETPPSGQYRAVAVLTVFFPEGHLSYDLPGTTKKAIWLPPPKVGAARFFQILFIRDREEDVRRLFLEDDQLLVAYHRLPNDEAVAVRSWSNEFEQPDMIVEASHGAAEDLVLPSQFEFGVKRPVGFSVYFQPEEMRCFELSGYWVPAGHARLRFPDAASISRTVVTERGASLTR